MQSKGRSQREAGNTGARGGPRRRHASPAPSRLFPASPALTMLDLGLGDCGVPAPDHLRRGVRPTLAGGVEPSLNPEVLGYADPSRQMTLASRSGHEGSGQEQMLMTDTRGGAGSRTSPPLLARVPLLA